MNVLEKVRFGGACAGWALLFCLMVFTAPSWVHASDVQNGKKIVNTRKLGNCVACHSIPGVESPGDIGPSLVEVMQGFDRADRKIVREWVWDARKFNPDTIMPPFGPNKLLTPKEIDDVVEYLYTLKK